jgi:hypothetical protein
MAAQVAAKKAVAYTHRLHAQPQHTQQLGKWPRPPPARCWVAASAGILGHVAATVYVG